MIRIGIIGCGKIAQVRHLPEYAANPHVELAGYYDLNTQRAQEMAAQYGGKVYDSYFDLLNDPSIDAVSICVENRSHAEITTYALYAGKHVLCEKPMAVTLAECESMVAAAERNGKHLMIGHNMRFDPVHRKAKELLDGGIIGDIITFRATMGNAGPENWSMEAGSTWFFDKQKAAMGALSDLGIHKVDLLQYLTGQKVIETTAKVMTLNKHTATGAPITVDDNALCILRMSGGAVGTLAASWTVYGHECQSTCLYGTKGIMLIYNNNNPAAPIEVRNLDGTSTTYNIPPETNSGVIDEFVDALEQNREPEVSGKEALSTMRAIFGADRLDSGEIYVKGEKVHIRTPKDAIKRKIAFLTEDRKGQGLVLNLDVRTNLVLANMKGFSNGPFLDKDRIEQAGNDNVSALKIKTPSLNEVVGQLSGGNQQKVVIGKWVNTDADIFIFDEPTRGIDVGAKIEVYRVMNDLVKAGKCVIMVSSELPEILAMSDHVVVMRGGRVMADIDRDTPHFNSEDIMKAAWGGELD